MSDDDVLRALNVLRRHGMIRNGEALQVALGKSHVYVELSMKADGMERKVAAAAPVQPFATDEDPALLMVRDLLRELQEA